MKRWNFAVAVTLSVLAVLLLTPVDIFSCGPFFTEAVFVSTRRPAPSIDDYLAGHLGVVQPSYYDVYLAIAYRVLSGKPISAEEIAKAKKYWAYDDVVHQSDDQMMQAWYAARAAARLPKPSSDRTDQYFADKAYKRIERTFGAYLNCTPDAFRNAALTVQSRTQRFGAGTPVMQDWVQAQDAVFSNCTEPQSVPDAAPANADPLIKADRAYQLAAAHFYREQFDQARAEFLQIAQDHSSPWSMIAPYLAARTLIRQATLSAPEDKPFDPKLLAQADTELRAILADKNAAEIHPAVLRTLGFVEFRLQPQQRMHTLALEISGEQPTTDLGQALIDYTRLLEQKTNDQQPAADDITDWILTAKSNDLAQAREHALARWQQTHALPWLIAALVKSKAQDTQVDALLKAAAAVPDDSPAHASASFERARLLVGQQKFAEARHLLDRELERVPQPPNQTRNLLLGLRWRVAQDFDEFLKFAPQVPVEYTNGYDEDEYCVDDNCSSSPENAQPKPVALFNVSVASTLNHVTPLQLLSDGTRSKLLPQNLRQALLLSTWTRAAILGDSAQAVALGKQSAQAIPETASYVNAYVAATDAETRQFAAVFAVLHFPGMRPYVNAGVLRGTPLAKIDEYRDNWWCEDVGRRIGVPNFDNELYSGTYNQQPSADSTAPPRNPLPPAPAFSSSQQRTEASGEWTRLSQIGTAPNYFGKVVLAWAKAHPDDARVPEALHLVVRSTRYGCTNRETTTVSKQAFDRLHSQYPKSQWAKQTPFWFN